MRTKFIALLMLLFCTFGVFAQAADDWYQNKPLRSITFQGLKNVSRTELDGLFAQYLGRNFNDELYMDVLQKLYALEYFDEINPVAIPGDADRNSVTLQFSVSEKPVIRNIKFSGTDKLRPAELLDKVALKEGDIYNELKARLDERSVRDLYLEKGYTNVKVSSEALKNDDGSISLRFTVAEGKQTVVSSISFEGNNVMAAKTLRGEMELKEAKLLNMGIFREALLESDKEKIRKYYIERGYVDASVESVLRETDPESTPDKTRLKLTFVIKEGDQYTYGGTEITGNSIFTTEELLSRIRMKEGDVMNQNRFDEGFQAIADVYYENGYTSNYLSPRQKRDVERKRISYLITVVESDRSHIEHIIVKGNTKTKDSVIRREFLLEPGDIFSKTKMLDSIRNLYNTRYFSIIQPDLVPGSEKNLVDVVVAVEEQSTASVQFGVTFSGVSSADSFPLSVFLQWEDKNFLGNGQTVSTNLTLSPTTQNVSIGYSENWFLGSPLSLSLNLSLSHDSLYAYQDSLYPLFDYPDDPVPDPYTSLEEYQNASSIDQSYRMKYDHWEYSLGASTGYRWSPSFAQVTLRGGLSFGMKQNFYDEKIYRPADRDIRDQHGQWVWNDSLWTRLSLDRRDISYDPTKGWFASEQVSLFGIIPGFETDYYLRSDTKLEGYQTLLNIPLAENWNLKLVLAAYAGLSMQIPVGQDDVSFSNRLAPDGMFIGRGWNSLYDVKRGKLLNDNWIELRLPLAAGMLATDFYFEGVAVKDDVRDIGSITLDDYYFSFGPSLRFSIPQFPLRLMFANTFQIKDGQVHWRNGTGPDWQFVLSFNISNQ